MTTFRQALVETLDFLEKFGVSAGTDEETKKEIEKLKKRVDELAKAISELRKP